MSYHYGSTWVTDEFSDNHYPHVRVCLDGDMLSRLFGHRELLVRLSREPPVPIALTYSSAAEFGRITRDGLSDEGERLLESGDLVHLSEVGRNTDPPSDEYFPEFVPTERGGEQAEVVSKSGVEFVWTPKYGRGSSFWVSWADLEVLYFDRPCGFPVSENVRALAAGILTEGATDRMPILADALDECGAPPWIGRGMREDRDWSNGWRHMLDVYEDRRPTDRKTPFFRSLAGLVPYEPIADSCEAIADGD